MKGGFNMMMERKIMLRKEDVKDFVNQASKCDFDIDIFYNRYVVDAKSILGVLALDLRQVLTVRCNGYNADFDNYLGQIALAG
jgi:hypothetical protein